MPHNRLGGVIGDAKNPPAGTGGSRKLTDGGRLGGGGREIIGAGQTHVVVAVRAVRAEVTGPLSTAQVGVGEVGLEEVGDGQGPLRFRSVGLSRCPLT